MLLLPVGQEEPAKLEEGSEPWPTAANAIFTAAEWHWKMQRMSFVQGSCRRVGVPGRGTGIPPPHDIWGETKASQGMVELRCDLGMVCRLGRVDVHMRASACPKGPPAVLIWGHRDSPMAVGKPGSCSCQDGWSKPFFLERWQLKVKNWS